jgi:hypothetical protein
VAGLAALVAASLAVGAWLSLRGHTAGQPVAGELPRQALVDSVGAATATGRWDLALGWAQRLARIDPRHPLVIRDLSVTWHNYAVGDRWRQVVPRAGLRTSLERMACESLAFALADSAERLAADPDAWTEAATWHGQLLETLGLPADALEQYHRVLRERPGSRTVAGRAYWIEAHLRDPQLPDRIAIPTRLLRTR